MSARRNWRSGLSPQLIDLLSQEPFQLIPFIDKLAYDAGYRPAGDSFNSEALEARFQNTITNVAEFIKEKNTEAEEAEAALEAAEKEHHASVAELQKRNAASVKQFSQLDKNIAEIAQSMLSLANSLQEVEKPRENLQNALNVLEWLTELREKQDTFDPSEDFAEQEPRESLSEVLKKSVMLRQLSSLTRELADVPEEEDRHLGQRIQHQYHNVQSQLHNRFVEAFEADCREDMKLLAHELAQHPQTYNDCLRSFCNDLIKGAALAISDNPFVEALEMCREAAIIIHAVFTDAERVFGMLVHRIYEDELSKAVRNGLQDKRHINGYLKNLLKVYSDADEFATQLIAKNSLADAISVRAESRKLMQKYLETYALDESTYLKLTCDERLRKFREKRLRSTHASTGGFVSTVKDKMGMDEGPPGETHICMNEAIELLDLHRQSLDRCKQLCTNDITMRAKTAHAIFESLLDSLGEGMVERALAIHHKRLQPLMEGKSAPDLTMINVVVDATNIFHSIDRHYQDYVTPLLVSRTHSATVMNKFERRLEQKVDDGLDAMLQAVINHCSRLLHEQRAADFRPETEGLSAEVTSVCHQVREYIKSVLRKLSPLDSAPDQGLDGKNLASVELELGLRFHRLLYDHLLRFQFNHTGGMLAICEVNEYKSLFAAIPLISKLFDMLHSLCNTLIVSPNNLFQLIFVENSLKMLDRSTIQQFVQLRVDYKSARIADSFRREADLSAS